MANSFYEACEFVGGVYQQPKSYKIKGSPKKVQHCLLKASSSRVRFTSGISHDLDNKLVGVSSNRVQKVIEGCKDDGHEAYFSATTRGSNIEYECFPSINTVQIDHSTTLAIAVACEL